MIVHAALALAITLIDAVDRAIAADPSLAASRAAADAAQAHVRESKAAWWPSLSLNGSAVRYEEPMLVTPIHGFTPGTTPEFDETLLQAGVQLEYALFDGGERGARVAIARAEADASNASLEASAEALIGSVLDAYLGALGARAIVEAHDRRIAALQGERERARRLFDAGRAAHVDVLRVEAELASAEANRASDAAERDVAERRLARHIGSGPEVITSAPLGDVALSSTSAAAREVSEDAALHASPARRIEERAAEVARLGVPLARSARWPQLSLLAALVDRGSDDGEFTAEWNAGVAVRLPLFTGGALAASARRAQASHSRAKESLRATDDSIRNDLDATQAAIASSRARIQSLESAVGRFEEVARVAKLLLESGSGTETEYLDSEADLLEARASLARARYAEIAAHARLARLTGALDRAWIVDHVRSME